MTSSETRTRTRTVNLRKKLTPLIHGPVGKFGSQDIKYLYPGMLLIRITSAKIFFFPIRQGISARPCSFELAHVPRNVQKISFSCFLSV